MTMAADGLKRIPLHAKDGPVVAHALVSGRDFERLSRWVWRLGANGYAQRGLRVDGRYRTIRMHREILGLGFGDPRWGEHENRNKLDCQRSNLRIVHRGHLDNQQNQGLRSDNSSGYRGVSWSKGDKKWAAYAWIDGRKHSLGRHDTPEGADVAAKAFRAEHMPFSEDAQAA